MKVLAGRAKDIADIETLQLYATDQDFKETRVLFRLIAERGGH